MYFKGMVIEIKGECAVVMNNDGTFDKINKKGNMKIGDKILYLQEDMINSKTKKNALIFKPFATVAAVLAIILVSLLLLTNRGEVSGYAVVTLDVNPSISIKIDENRNIVEATGLNDDATLLNLEELKDKPFEEGIKIIKDKILSSTTITNKESAIFAFAFLGNKEDQGFEELVKKTVAENFTGFDLVYLKATKEDVKKADEKGISLGKYESLVKLEEDNLEEELEKLTVPELTQLLKENSEAIILNEDFKEEVEEQIEDKLEDEEEAKEETKEEENNKEQQGNEEDVKEQENTEDEDNEVNPTEENKPVDSPKPKNESSNNQEHNKDQESNDDQESGEDNEANDD